MAGEVTMALPRGRRLWPVAALLWEEWRQTRTYLFVLLVVSAFMLALFLLGGGNNLVTVRDSFGAIVDVSVKWPHRPTGFEVPFFAFVFMWQAAVLLFSGYGRNDLSLRFPRRLFALPLPTAALAGARMMYGVTVVACTSAAFGAVLARLYEDPLYWLLPPIFAALNLLYVYAVAWTLGRRPILASFVGLALWPGLAYGYWATLGSYGGATDSVGLAGASALVVLFNAVLVFALADVAVRGVAAARHGGRRRGHVRRRMGNLVGAVTHPLTPAMLVKRAKAPDYAQQWLEWHRRGRWVPYFSAAGVVLAAFAQTVGLFGSRVDFDDLAQFAFSGSLAGLAAAGLFQYLISDRDRVSGLNRYILTRPCSTYTLAAARLKALAKGLGLTYLLVAGIGFIGLYADNPESFVEAAKDAFVYPLGRHGDMGIVQLAFLLGAWILAGWVLVTLIIPLLALYVALILASMVLRSLGASPATVLFSAIVFTGVVLAVELGLFVQARRKNVLPSHAVVLVGVAWLATYVGGLVLTEGGGSGPLAAGYADIFDRFFLLPVTLFPYLSLATVPLGMHRSRHG